jgi:aryl-alcohol dehydrogenase-like predicted oxidoreductase
LYAGLSNFPAWRTSRAVTLAELRGLLPIAGIQVEYSLVERSADRENLPMAEALGLGVAMWSPLGGGLLTGKYRSGGRGRLTDMAARKPEPDDGRKEAIVDTVLSVSRELGLEPATVAIAWLLERARRSSTGIVPIAGPRKPDQLDTYIQALGVTLDGATYDRLEAASRVDLGAPHNLIAKEHVRTLGGDPEAYRSHAALIP